LQQAPFIDFPEEPKWHLFESIQVCPGEEIEADKKKDEHRQFMEYHKKFLQEIDQTIEEEVRWYASHIDTITKGMVPIVEEQEPIIVSMVLVDPAQPSMSATASHGEGSGGGIGTGPGLISSTQEAPTAVVVNAPCDSEKNSQVSSEEEEAGESARRGREMSSIERTLRSQAVTALNNPSALLLHAISMNEVSLFDPGVHA
jgi:hypothetical protein